MKGKRAVLNVVMIVAVLVGLGASMGAAWADVGDPTPKVLPPDDTLYGRSYGDWGAEWWRWQLELPATGHPAFDVTGELCDVGQTGSVFFLTGTFTSEVPPGEVQYPGFSTIVRESCHVPHGKAVFFPIVNVECSTGDPQDYLWDATTDELAECAQSYVDGPIAVISAPAVTIDGVAVPDLEAYRALTPPFRYTPKDPEDNINGVDCDAVRDDGVKPVCKKAEGVGDGYWIMLEPLSRGSHTIRFTGSFLDPADPSILYFGLDVTYLLTVD